MNRSPMPARKTPMPRGNGLSRSAPMERGGEMKRTATRQRASRDTGFPAKVKLQIRRRAGNGDEHAARCEHCGAFLGLYGGDYQHIVARGMGGTRNPLLNTAANGALLCRPSHDLAESRSPEMEALGFWARQGTDPRAVPMMLFSPLGSGITVWRSESGQYLLESPQGAAA